MKDIDIAQQALEMCLKAGAQKVRICYTYSCEDLISTLNSQIDRITHNEDVSLSFNLFVDGRYGVYSTNKVQDLDSLKFFIDNAIALTRSLAPDSCRDLPAKERYCTTAITGDELELFDPLQQSISPEKRIEMALDAAIFDKKEIWEKEFNGINEDYAFISEEGEYSDSIYEVILLDSNGLNCRHRECSFDYGVEVTVSIADQKYNSYYWESSSSLKKFDYSLCGLKALQKAIAQRSSEAIKSGKYNMIVDREVASKVCSPILRALLGGAIQQQNSFLIDKQDEKVFSEGLTIVDIPHILGDNCSKLFDTEGVATKDSVIIEKGVVKEYFLNTYYSNKLGLSPTKESAVRPKLLPYPQSGLDLEQILQICKSGIYVTEFNGGNSNAVSGDFSFGVDGFYFADGKIVKPISQMLITGNLITLWNNLIACGDDYRPCMSKLIPTLAFSNVDFSGE